MSPTYHSTRGTRTDSPDRDETPGSNRNHLLRPLFARNNPGTVVPRMSVSHRRRDNECSSDVRERDKPWHSLNTSEWTHSQSAPPGDNRPQIVPSKLFPCCSRTSAN